MPFIVQKFKDENNNSEYEKTFWDYEDAQNFVAQEVFEEKDKYESKFKDRHPGVKVRMNMGGVTIRYKGAANEFVIKISEKDI